MDTKIVFLTFMCCVTRITVSGATLRESSDVVQISSDKIEDVKDPIIYLDLASTQTNSNETSNSTSNAWRPDWKVQLPFAGAQCSCENQKCSCCANIRVSVFGFDREACATMNYRPWMNNNENINMAVSVNNSTIARNSFPVRDSSLFCVPKTTHLPIGPVDFCVKLTEVSVIERKLHLCMNMMTRVSERPVVLLRFDCINIDGVGSHDENGSEIAAENNASNTVTEIEGKPNRL